MCVLISHLMAYSLGHFKDVGANRPFCKMAAMDLYELKLN